MVRVRAFLASLGNDELSVAAQTVLGLIVVFVPFGSLVLLTRWAPVRRQLCRLAPRCRAVDLAGPVPEAPPAR